MCIAFSAAVLVISGRIKKCFRSRRLNPLEEAVCQHTYVAYADILGFSQLVESDFEAARDLYQRFLDNRDMVTQMRKGTVVMRIVSDSVLLTSTNLAHLIGAAQMLNFVTLTNDFLIRGGIAAGQHVEGSSNENLFIVSEPLIKAVKLEKRIAKPCIVIDSTVDIPDEWWLYTNDPFQRPILFYDNIRLINPFNVAWGYSARHRVKLMGDKYPQHKDKYDWFIQLYEEVKAGSRLVPPHLTGSARSVSQGHAKPYR